MKPLKRRGQEVQELRNQAQALHEKARALEALDEAEQLEAALGNIVPLLQQFTWKVRLADVGSKERGPYFIFQAKDTNDKTYNKASDALHEAFGFSYHSKAKVREGVELRVNDGRIDLVFVGIDANPYEEDETTDQSAFEVLTHFLESCPLRIDPRKFAAQIQDQVDRLTQMYAFLDQLTQ